MNKDIKKIERPKMLTQTLLEMVPGQAYTIYPTAFKTSQVRIAASRINKKFNKKIFFVSDKGMNDRCVVTRLQ